MALAQADILQIIDVQTFLSSRVLNVYFYRVETLGASVDYQNLSDAFQLQVRDIVRNIQVSSLTHDSVIIKNLSNGVDIFEEADQVAGDTVVTGDPLASFYALGYRLVRSTAATRHGAKRIAGIPEGAVTGNSITAISTQNTAIEAALGGVVEVDAGGDFDFVLQPVIVGRYPQGDPNAGQLDLTNVNDVASAQFIRVTTQNSRKLGRGV